METSASFEARSAPSSYPTAVELEQKRFADYQGFEVPTLDNRLRRDSANNLFIQIMVCRDKIISLGKPRFGFHPETDGRVVVHYGWRQKFPAWAPSGHSIPQSYDSAELASLPAKPVFILTYRTFYLGVQAER